MAALDPAPGPDGTPNADGERGTIVTTSSVAGYEGQIGQLAYATAKAGIIGMMMESFLVDGRQELTDPTELVYGQSITDGCMGWEASVPVLRELAGAARARRQL